MRLVLAIWLVILIASCHAVKAATWYVRPGVFDSNGGSFPCNPVPRSGVYGSQNGTSYANAWNGLTAIQFGPTAVTNGDTVYVCGVHIYPVRVTSFVAFQAVCPIACSNVTFRLDYALDPGTVFGGSLDNVDTPAWSGPDANGVYWSTFTKLGGSTKELQFEIQNGTNIVRLGHMTNTTWTGRLGSQAFIGGTNFVKTIEGTAPSTNLAIGTIGWAFDQYLASNTVFQSGTWVSSDVNFLRSDHDLGTALGYYATNMLGPQSTHWTNCTRLSGSPITLYPGYNFPIVSGCTIMDAPYGVYAFYDSRAYTATNGIVTGNTIIGTDTPNYPHIDGHAIAVRDGVNWTITLNTLIGNSSAIDIYVDNLHTSSNHLVAQNYIQDTHKTSSGISGGGIVFDGSTTLGLCISNRVLRNVMANIGTNAVTTSQGPGIAVGPGDYILIANNTIFNPNVGIYCTPAGTPLNLSALNNIIMIPRYRYWTLVGTGTATVLQLDYNDYYPAVNSSDSKFSLSPSATHDTHSVYANPRVFNTNDPVAISSFRLTSTSPAILAGTTVDSGPDYYGRANTLDIGALVYVPTSATTNYAFSTCRDDVQAAIDSTPDGGTVIVPNGVCYWNTNIVIVNGVSLLATGSVAIADNVADTSVANNQCLIDVESLTNKTYRISGFTFFPGTNRVTSFSHGIISLFGFSHSIRIDHCTITNTLNNGLYPNGGVWGVADHNTFVLNDNHHGIFCHHPNWGGPQYSFGDFSFVDPPSYGTSNAWYSENNYFKNTQDYHGGIDGQGGMRLVSRYDVFDHEYFGIHGEDSGGALRSSATIEVYADTFIGSDAQQYPIVLRGAGGPIQSNTFTGTWKADPAPITAWVYRTHHSFPFWGGASGVNPWDSNDPALFFSGNHTGSSSSPSYTPGSPGWTPNQWQGYTISTMDGVLFGEIESNTVNTVFISPDFFDPVLTMLFTNGVPYQIRRVLSAMGAPGHGTGNLIVRSPLTPAWPNETLNPLYSWTNVINGTNALIGRKQTLLINENVEYYNNTPKPGYTPFVYPHPLVGPAATNIPPSIIGPPQNVTVHLGDTASFEVIASGTAPLAYQWSLGGVEIGAATTSTYTTPATVIGDSGNIYTVAVTNLFGSVTSSPAVLSVLNNSIVMSGKVTLSGAVTLQ